MDENEKVLALLLKKEVRDATHLPLNISIEDFVICKLIYNFGTRKEEEKKFIAHVQKLNAEGQRDQYKLEFLKKKTDAHSEDTD